MRYGVLADIHGNLHALQEALASLRRAGVDGYLCLGDLVGYGPYPNECVETVAGLDAVCVAGNHDLIALERLPWDQCIRLARESLAWTRQQLRDDVRSYLSALPASARVGDEIVLAHGSLDNPREYVTRPEQAEAQLRQLELEYPEARLLLLGHTHRRLLFGQEAGLLSTAPSQEVSWGGGERFLVNPGSVGQSRERHAEARFMVLDAERRRLTFHAAVYPVELCRQALRRAGRPVHSCHLRPSPLRSCAGRMRRLARQALSALRPV